MQFSGILVRVDPGWLFVLSGAAVLCATVLIPAHDELAEAQHLRTQAQSLLAHRHERLDHHQKYLEALERRSETVLLDLARSQLNLIQADQSYIITPVDVVAEPALVPATPFASLEPAPARASAGASFHPRDTLLRRLTTNRKVRLWLIAASALSILFGLLPSAEDSEQADDILTSRRSRVPA